MSHKNKINKYKSYIIYITVAVFLLILFAIIYYYNAATSTVNNNGKNVKNFPLEIQNILKMQREEGTNSIMKINCSTLTLENAKEYCIIQQGLFR